MEKTCILCGKVFSTKSSRRSFCYENHYHPCPICGKEVLTKDLNHQNECCCKEHSRQLADRTSHERYETWPSATLQAKEKRAQTCIEKYGVNNPSKNTEVKKRVSKGLLDRYAIDGADIRKRAEQTYSERTGYRYPAQNPEVVAKVKQKNMLKYGVESTFSVPEYKDKTDKTNIEKYGTTIPMQNRDVWAKQRSQKSKHVAMDGTLLDSSYEVDVYNYCLRNNISVERTYPISYQYNGQAHKTFIDFVIDGLLVEVKGEHALDGYYDSQPDAVPIQRKLEVYKENNVIVVTGLHSRDLFKNSVGLKYQTDLSQLIGVDIELFRNPAFPFAENRPELFYKVKVGPKSCYDAFYDEKIRWDMIKNRIQYVGGFISAKEVLTALNVTRLYKQPSWFAKSYAKDLIKKYSTCETIVDPFAGWGTRHDAAIECHRNYIGCDLNAELVEWHKKHNRSIVLQDAKDFKYDGVCDVLTCPPYRDTEIYFEGQDVTTTECQWLDVIRKNVPNAKKYIMVCKEVSPEYEQYVVDRKENKSHFGTNYEYVIVVDQTQSRK